MVKAKIALTFFLTFPLAAYASGGKVSLEDHWTRPVVIGVVVYKHFSAGILDGSPGFYPENCADCHSDRHEDWSGSLHSKAVGPGLEGQLNPRSNPDSAASCYFCHAPAAEQKEMVEKSVGTGEFVKNTYFDAKLKKSGVSCAICHMRGGQIFGPPQLAGKKSRAELIPSKNFIAKDFFEDARFCAACHQLDEGYELNGKVLVNTYREWKNSKYGRENITCQNCHMPGGRHLFRGIHDPEMVKKGITIEAGRKDNGPRVSAWIKLTNSGVGHMFPTYATPLVIVKGFLSGKDGKEIKETVKVDYIGRMVSIDLSREIADSRIPPLESIRVEYAPKKLHIAAEALVFEVWVYPDMFYNLLYKRILANNSFSIKSDIEQAIVNTEKSPYLLFRQEFKNIARQE